MRFFLLVVLISLVQSIFAQEAKIELEGTVTYLTAQHIYVKFSSTQGIKNGDQIYVRKKDSLISILQVENCSSVSCVGKPTTTEKLSIGDKVVAFISRKEAVLTREAAAGSAIFDTTAGRKPGTNPKSSVNRERISGRIQLSSYSNFSNSAGSSSNRMRYIWTMNGTNIGNSKFSFDSYLSFSHQLKNWAPIKENIFNGLKIYDFNLKYEASSRNTFWLGRKINPKISSIGAIDGIQFEQHLDHFYWGIVAGFRPDYTDYSFNAKLLEYGAFLGHLTQNSNGNMQTSLAGFNQTNSGKTDRRFLYFQHDNSLLKNVNLFFSSEIDLYKMVNGLPVNEVSLTSMYLMLNYRLSGKFSVSGSYDNRRNVIYYETFKNYIDVMLADATRQGVMLRLNFRPIPYMNVGLSTSYWDRAGDSKPTTNYNGIFSYTQLPLIKATVSLTVNALQTSYVDGMIYGVRIDKDFLNGKLNWGINYRYVDYVYQNSSGKLLEHIAETDFSVQLTRKLSLSVNYEGTFESQNTYHQLYGSLIKRF